MNYKQAPAYTNRRPPVLNTRPFVLTRWTLVLIDDNGSAQEIGCPLLTGETEDLFKTSRRFFDTDVRFFETICSLSLK